MTNTQLPQPDEKVQPIRVIPQREEFVEEAEVAGIDDLVEFRAFYTRDVLLFGALAGPEDGEPVVLLHGFPDFWLGWARQIRPLVEAGARVIVPDQRGYNKSEKPQSVDAYRLPELGRDVVDLLDAVGADTAHVVGHDWGGGVAWWLAEHCADRFDTVTVLNCPHPAVMGQALNFGDIRQMLRSWYIAYFQIPHLPELSIRATDYRFLEAALNIAHEGAFSRREIELYRRAWAQEGAVRSMINWYRAAGETLFEDRSETGSSAIEVPLQIIWGKEDPALDRSLVEPCARLASNAQLHWVEDATHWVQRDRPEVVNEKLVDIVGE